MDILVPLLIAFAVGLLVLTLVDYFSERKHIVTSRMDELYAGETALDDGGASLKGAVREQLVLHLTKAGEKLRRQKGDQEETTRLLLVQAGFQGGPVSVFVAARMILAGLLAFLALVITPFLASDPLIVFGAVGYFLAVGFWVPRFWLKRRVRLRQKQLGRALPDAVDLLVVCVEAGLGLNQALIRVAKEIGHISPALGAELKHTNMEIQTGTARDEAFRNLTERTGLGEMRALVTMIIQADRFGTSVAQALRVHSESLRTKRRQLAEEAAAKTTVKLVFPLVFFVFPALFVVILGPAAINIAEQMKHLT